MKLHTQIALGFIASLLAVSVATAADPGSKMKHEKDKTGCYGMGMMQNDMKVDHVARAQKHLSELKAGLNLTKDQEPAWSNFSDQVITQAKSMASMQEDMKKYMQNMPRTAPERIEMMANRMKDRAQHLAAMSDTVKTFYNTLTPEQKIVFDKKMQINHMGHM
ncbi:MAG: Spy/CpxP family protein refolding chaperone [Sulfuricaulis sp.]|uniref:Spy/CpxP family protein refolding chaperone n=1 Tax=Sulfuricaulis sp. TaxID=2003553 RepID=UPI003C579306